MKINYINLTAGLAWIVNPPPDFKMEGDYRFLHLQSSHLESKAYSKFFDSIPDDLLINLALGNEVVIYEASSNSMPKLFKIGFPLIELVLEYLWFKQVNLKPRLDPRQQFIALAALSNDFIRRAKYARAYLKTEYINIKGRTIHLKKEDRGYLIKESLRRIKG